MIRKDCLQLWQQARLILLIGHPKFGKNPPLLAMRCAEYGRMTINRSRRRTARLFIEPLCRPAIR